MKEIRGYKLEPIDFVVTWVDNQDPEWQREKNEYSPQSDIDGLNGESRYRDFDIFKYWFRAVEKHASWVNKVYLITNGRNPDWINSECSKLCIVNHKDYIDPKYLPTFNSNVIELNLHHIASLKNQFVLFNDDTFINLDVRPSDFFKSGKPRDQYFESPIIPASGTISHTIVNDMMVINDHFSKRKFYKNNLLKVFNPLYGKNLIRTLSLLPGRQFCGIWNSHIPIAYKKDVWQHVASVAQGRFNDTYSHRFRSEGDVNHWLVRYWQLVSGNFEKQKSKFGMNFNLTGSSLDTILHEMIHPRYSLICINDTDELEDFSQVKRELIDAFETLYPQPSMFEIQN